MIRDPLRANQTDVLHRAIAAVNRGKNPCIVSPTGTGKTVVAAAVIKSFPERFVLVISDRRTIIGQTKDSFSELDISAGAIMAGVAPDHMRRVQVASAQSFRARYLDGKQALPPVGLILHDECHHAPARTHRRIREAYPGVPVVGFTATPVRSDDRGLGSYFDVLIEAPQVQQQINLGFLVPTLVYAPVRPDLDRVHVRCGEYVEGELAEVMAKLIGNVTHDWCKFGEDRRTISFAVNRAHARAIEIAFNQIGVRAEYIDGSTSLDERDAIFGRLERGVTKVVSTCEAISEGWNLPCVSCCILAKPTRASAPTSKRSVACCAHGPRAARPMQSSLITVTPRACMAGLKTRLCGRCRPTGRRRTPSRLNTTSAITASGSLTAQTAAQSAMPARHV